MCYFLPSFLSVYNLTNEVDVEDTKQVIEAYKRENAAQIKKNKSKLVGSFCLLSQGLEKL